MSTEPGIGRYWRETLTTDTRAKTLSTPILFFVDFEKTCFQNFPKFTMQYNPDNHRATRLFCVWSYFPKTLSILGARFMFDTIQYNPDNQRTTRRFCVWPFCPKTTKRWAHRWGTPRVWFGLIPIVSDWFRLIPTASDMVPAGADLIPTWLRLVQTWFPTGSGLIPTWFLPAATDLIQTDSYQLPTIPPNNQISLGNPPSFHHSQRFWVRTANLS